MPIPKVRDYEDEVDYMERCIKQLKRYGHSQNEAKVICYSTWQNKDN